VKKSATLATSSFVIVADLRPASPVIVLMTPVYTNSVVSGEDLPAHDHRVAVLYDDDEDERVSDALGALVYRWPTTYKKVIAIAEHRGRLTVWTQAATNADRAVLYNAADPVATRGDRWQVEVRERIPGRAPQDWQVQKYTEDGAVIQSVEKADARDLLIKALFEIVPLGADWSSWDAALYSNPGEPLGVGAAGPRGGNTPAQSEPDLRPVRDIKEVLAQTQQGRREQEQKDQELIRGGLKPRARKSKIGQTNY
jgi:hypothetical protein